MPVKNKINWTKPQKEFIDESKKGKFVVSACPGSGKTSTVSKKLALMIDKWKNNYKGIATISFTNVASEEIKSNVENIYKIKIPFPHYIGTIDSFINKYIFLPYGHLIMKCQNRPILVGEPHGKWHAKYFYEDHFDKIIYNINGELINKTRLNLKQESKNKILKRKKIINSTGFATQSDANYFSMKILESYPNISKLICKRFPCFIIDEAQDTSDIQMKIFDLLIKNNLKNIMFIGDPEQAIFEWNDAKPEKFKEKFYAWSENSMQFKTNFRSSNDICKFASKFSENHFISKSDCYDFSINENIIISYSENIQEIIKNFIDLCKKYEITISQENVAVLFRSKNFAKKFVDGIKFKDITINNIWKDEKDRNKENFSKDFLKGKFLWDNENKIKGFKLIEKAVIKAENDLAYIEKEKMNKIIFEKGFSSHRKKIMKIIKLLPVITPEKNVNKWVLETNDIFSEKNISYKINEIKNSTKHNFKKRLLFNDLFFDKEDSLSDEYYMGTVHSVKGKSFDAVLLILKSKAVNNVKYSTLLNKNIPLDNSEELRIIYVGITRPRKILQIAVPKNDKKYWIDFFKNKQISLDSFF
ncbi:MAG: ATP-dependent helicase [Methanobacteriaceae archaeon]|nr:ATP-dependent helicase [Methanobacteriaceae archaeon]